MFETVLIAGRGEIAVRVIETCRRLGVRAVAVYSDADAHALHVRLADERVPLGRAPAAESYLDIDRVIEAARLSGAEAVHPCYGFLAENPEAARRFAAAGLVWVGPSPQAIETMGDKAAARKAVAGIGVPVTPGSEEPVDEIEDAVRQAARIGYPLMVKAAAGGGGIGMSRVDDEAALRAAFGGARGQAERAFGAPALLLERLVPAARHVEVQVLGLADGRILALGERDCSVQRRYQKLAEETPAPGLFDGLRADLARAARQVAEVVDFQGAGTVEFLLSRETGAFTFCEMNTRLQVEHPVTELVTGIDLVEQQLRIAAGEPPSFDPDEPPRPHGHAIEVRVYAEDPDRFLPRPGKITAWRAPTGDGVRVDAGYARGDTVPQHYDPLLAKLAVWAEDRPEALERLGAALDGFEIAGPACNLPFFTELLADPGFRAGDYDTGIVAALRAGD